MGRPVASVNVRGGGGGVGAGGGGAGGAGSAAAGVPTVVADEEGFAVDPERASEVRGGASAGADTDGLDDAVGPSRSTRAAVPVGDAAGGELGAGADADGCCADSDGV
jgi:hypothetical protein